MKQLPVRDVSRSFFEALKSGDPPTVAGMVDFGIKSNQHLAALRHEIRCGNLTLEDLDEACCYGPALTNLISASNPYFGLTFQTDWDSIMVPINSWTFAGQSRFPLGRIFATPKALKLVTRSDINDAVRRHAEGDWGEGDAEANEDAFENEIEIVSHYRAADDERICVETRFEPNMTIVSLDREVGEEE